MPIRWVYPTSMFWFVRCIYHCVVITIVFLNQFGSDIHRVFVLACTKHRHRKQIFSVEAVLREVRWDNFRHA